MVFWPAVQTREFSHLSHLGADARAGQLAVIDLNVVPLHGLLHAHQRVSRHLVHKIIVVMNRNNH